MKQKITLLLVVAIIFSLVGCANVENDQKVPTANNEEVITDDTSKPEKDLDTNIDKIKPTEPASPEVTPEEPSEEPSEPVEEPKVEDTTKDKGGKESPQDKEDNLKYDPNEKYTLIGKVAEIFPNELLVEELNTLIITGKANQYYVPTHETGIPLELKAGDLVIVTHSGEVKLSAPARITKVFKIEKHTLVESLPLRPIAPINPGLLKPIHTFDSEVVYANWTSAESIYWGSLNAGAQYPMYKFTSKTDVENFKSKFSSILSMNKFEELSLNYDDEFFKNNEILLSYVTASSGSVRYMVNAVSVIGKRAVIELNVDYPEIGTCDMAGWFVIVIVPKGTLDNCTQFETIISNGPKEF